MSITVFFLKNEPQADRHDPIWMAVTVPVLGEAEKAKRDQAALDAFDSGHYEEVAKSTMTDPEDVWVALQNGVRTPSWTLQPPEGVSPTKAPELINGQPYGHRSSSVGDIFRDDETGELSIVASFGFDTLKRPVTA